MTKKPLNNVLSIKKSVSCTYRFFKIDLGNIGVHYAYPVLFRCIYSIYEYMYYILSLSYFRYVFKFLFIKFYTYVIMFLLSIM